MTKDNIKPDYEFDAYLKKDNKKSVLCNVSIWLPKDADENVHLEIDSPENIEIIKSFMGNFVSFESEIYEESPRFVATISKAWIGSVTQQAEQRKLARTKIKLLHAWDLTISEKTVGQGESADFIDTVYFQISNLVYAQPDVWIVPSYLGSRTVEIKKNYTAKSVRGYLFKLEKHYSEYTMLSKNKEMVTSQNVISVSAIDKINLTELDKLESEARNLALLLSFAARHQVTVLGHEYRAGYQRVRYYKDPVDRVKTKHKEIVEDALIPIEHFEEFINGALQSWDAHNEKFKNVIKDAIVSIHPMNDSYQSYLNMFSAFEGIVSLFKTNIKTELDNDWCHLEQRFNTFIDSQSLSCELKFFLKDDIKQIRNREKFASKADACFKRLSVSVGDIWPLFGDNSLYQIRNMLAHGRRTELDAVYKVAQEQLQLLVERLILAMLGFDYNNSTAGKTIKGIRLWYTKDEIIKFQAQLKA